MKKLVKRGICILLICVSMINTYRMFFQYNKTVPDLSDQIMASSANYEQKWQGDYVIYDEYNNLRIFPYIFGTRMYLYSAKDGTKHLIHRQLKPFRGLSSDAAFYGNQILCLGGFAWDMLSDNLLVTLNAGSKFIDLDSAYMYVISSDGIYYIRDEYDDLTGHRTGQGLYCYHQNTDSSKKICKVSEYDDLRFIVQEKAFIINDDTECAYVCNLRTKEITDLSYDTMPDYITEQDDNTFWGIFENGDVWKYETKTMHRTYVCKIDGISDDDWWRIYARYMDGYLYVSNQKGEVVKIHDADGKQEILVEQSDIPNIKNLDSWYDTEIYFCDSNIVYVVYYEHYDALSQFWYDSTEPIKKLLTFDYQGNLIRTEKG